MLIGIETNSLNREFIKNFFYRLVNKNVKYIKINYTIESDVRSEIERVTSSNLKDLAKTEPLVVNRIVKLFKKKQMYFAAVDNLSFGVKAQRCFGLLVITHNLYKPLPNLSYICYIYENKRDLMVLERRQLST